MMVTSVSTSPVSRVVRTETVTGRGHGCDGGLTLIRDFCYLGGDGTHRCLPRVCGLGWSQDGGMIVVVVTWLRVSVVTPGRLGGSIRLRWGRQLRKYLRP